MGFLSSSLLSIVIVAVSEASKCSRYPVRLNLNALHCLLTILVFCYLLLRYVAISLPIAETSENDNMDGRKQITALSTGTICVIYESILETVYHSMLRIPPFCEYFELSFAPEISFCPLFHG